MPTISLANLKQISGITKAYLWQEPGKYHAYLRHIPWISQKTLRHLNYIKGKSQAFCRQISGIFKQATHGEISDEFQANLGYNLGISHTYLRGK